MAFSAVNRRDLGFGLSGLMLAACASTPPVRDGLKALVGATVLDGAGGPVLTNATLLISGNRIREVHVGRDTPPGAQVIDVSGCWITPGFIDANVHFSMIEEERYFGLRDAIALEHAQRMLKHGITTVRDSYGYLGVVRPLRDRINRGEVVGPRMLVAGNIIGWGGPFSTGYNDSPFVDALTDEMRRYNEANEGPSYRVLNDFMRRANAEMTQGVGEELTRMDEAGVRRAIRAYITERGPDFIKYAANGHFTVHDLIFTPEIQRALVDEAHACGVRVDVHAMGFAAQEVAVRAGVDLVQHIATMGGDVTGPYPDSELEALARHRPMATVNSQQFAAFYRRRELDLIKEEFPTKSSAEVQRILSNRNRRRDDDIRRVAQLREVGLVPRLCFANDGGRSPDNMAEDYFRPGGGAGVASLRCIEGLVGMGLSPMEAIICATRNGAEACGALDQYGTLEPGKLADLVILEADPLEDIANIHRQRAVMKEGRFIDTAALPIAPVPPVPGTR